MGIERREKGRRAEVVKAVVDHVVHKAESTVTLEGLAHNQPIDPKSYLIAPPKP